MMMTIAPTLHCLPGACGQGEAHVAQCKDQEEGRRHAQLWQQQPLWHTVHHLWRGVPQGRVHARGEGRWVVWALAAEVERWTTELLPRCYCLFIYSSSSLYLWASEHVILSLPRSSFKYIMILCKVCLGTLYSHLHARSVCIRDFFYKPICTQA